MGLRDDVVGILRDRHCRSIDFYIAGLHVTGAGLREVADCIERGAVAFRARDGMSTPGRYRFARDELLIRSDVADDLDDSNIRSLIVHEAVHALADLRRHRRMTNIQSESSGFVAQALYRLKYRNGRRWRSRVDIFREALEVVVAKDLIGSPGTTVGWDDYAGLRRAIQDHPNYADDDHDASAGATGIRGHRARR